jgi:hypothetical protein
VERKLGSEICRSVSDYGEEEWGSGAGPVTCFSLF